MTPVEVSLCGEQYASIPASAVNTGAVPGSAVMIVGLPRWGAFAAPEANFAPNSPNERNCARLSSSPNVAMSQNAVEPPFPRTTS